MELTSGVSEDNYSHAGTRGVDATLLNLAKIMGQHTHTHTHTDSQFIILTIRAEDD